METSGSPDAKRLHFSGGVCDTTLLSVAGDTLLPLLGMLHVGPLRCVNEEALDRVTQYP